MLPTDVDAGALDVMDAALAGESPTSNQGVATEGTEPDPGLLVEAEDGTEVLEAGEGAVKPVVGEDPTGQGRERNPDGTFKPKVVAAPIAKAPEIDPLTGKPKATAAVVPEIDPLTGKPKVAVAKDPDPINDPLPKDMKAETKARVEKLIDIARTSQVERDTVQQSLDGIVEAVQKTGSTPEQYGELLSWMGLFNSPETAQKEKALELAVSVVERLSTMLGKPVSFSDPVTGHADLVAELAANKLTPTRAREIAVQRNQTKLNGEMQQHVHQSQLNADQQLEQDTVNARAALTELGTTLAAVDPQYAQKKAILLPQLKPLFDTLPPNQWKAKFESEYRKLVIRAPATTAPVVPRNQPLRGNRNGTGGSGTATTPITDPIQVMNAALASMG